MAGLEERALTRHRSTAPGTVHRRRPPLHGPAPAQPAVPPSHAAEVTAILDCPSLTGMSRQDLAALAAAPRTPFNAAREQDLLRPPRRAAARPGPGRHPCRGKPGPAARLLATVPAQRLPVPSTCSPPSSPSTRAPSATPIRITAPADLTAAASPSSPPRSRLRTFTAFCHYAKAAGIDPLAAAELG